MRPIRSFAAFLGLAALAVTALVVHEVRAADKDQIHKIADSIKAGKMDAAKADAKAYAGKNKEVDDLMDGFGKKGLIAEGIGKKLTEWEKKGIGAADLINPNYQDIGAMAAAISLVCDSVDAPKGQKGNQAQWTMFAKNLNDKGVKFQAAFKTKMPAAIKAAAAALNSSCTNCHAQFR
ncbi:MAG TPA: hypothetical protein VHR72_04345 [Gemmataceae bacterium]|jgi:hypothetical protein|nr:hypothetical protein [Gemmataceae bacterium]